MITNLWISFLISKRLIKLDKIILSENIEIVFSKELFDEIYTAANKPRLRKYFTIHSVEEMITNFEPYINFIEAKLKLIYAKMQKTIFYYRLQQIQTQIFCLQAIMICWS